VTAQTARRLEVAIEPHRLDPPAHRHPGRLGLLDALVDAVELANLTHGPDSPLRPHLLLIAERLGAALERPAATTGADLHDHLMDAQAPLCGRPGDE